jgi:hypothetical protein
MSLSLSGPLTITSSSPFNLGTNEFTIEWWQYGTSSGTGNIITVGNLILQKNGNLLNVYDPVTAGIDKTLGTVDMTATFGNKWTHFSIIRRNNIFDGSSYKDYVYLHFNNTYYTILFFDRAFNDFSDFSQSSTITIGNNTEPFQLLYNFSMTIGNAKYTGNFTPSKAPPLNDGYSYNIILYVNGANVIKTATGVYENQTFTLSENATISNNNPLIPVPLSKSLILSGPLTVTSSVPFNLGRNEFTIEWWQYGTSSGTGNIITVGNFKLYKNGTGLSTFDVITQNFVNLNVDIFNKFGNKWNNFKIIRRNNISGNDVIDLIVNNTDFYNIFNQQSSFGDLDFSPGSLVIGNTTEPFHLLYNFSILIGTAKVPLSALSTVAPLYESSSYNLILYVGDDNFGASALSTTGTGDRLNDVFTILGNTTFSTNIPSTTTNAISTICFVAGTPVLTDNYGYVHIDQLVPCKHTINNYKVLTVTKSVTPEQHLSVIPAGSLCEGVPCADTIMSLNHCIKIN